MTKQTGLHLEYCRMRRRYAVIVIGGGRSPWKGVRRAGAVCSDASHMPCIHFKQDQLPRKMGAQRIVFSMQYAGVNAKYPVHRLAIWRHRTGASTKADNVEKGGGPAPACGVRFP